MTETIVLVSCVKGKRAHPSSAKDLYTSDLFRKARRFAEGHGDRWFILSAKYGLVHPDAVIEPYEQTLNTMGVADRRRWAAGVFEQMKQQGLVHPEMRYLWLAGAKYQQDLARLLPSNAQHDPLRGKKIGERLSWLKQQNHNFSQTDS